MQKTKKWSREEENKNVWNYNNINNNQLLTCGRVKLCVTKYITY